MIAQYAKQGVDFVKLPQSDPVKQFLYQTGSQSQGYKDEIARKLTDYVNQQFQQQAKDAIDAGINPENYRFPEEAVTDFGAGSDANKRKAATQSMLLIASQQKALPKVQSALQQYKETGLCHKLQAVKSC